MAKLLPATKSSIVKVKGSTITNPQKITKIGSKKSLLSSSFVKKSGDNLLLGITKKVIKVDKLLKNSLLLKKKQQESKRRDEEKSEFDKREKELETKKLPTVKGVGLPTPPKLGILDWIKNFIFNTIFGFIAVRLVDHLPKLLNLLPTIIKVTDFITDVGGKMLDGLITFIDWGYKAYDATRGFVKNIGGEGLAQTLDKFGGALNGLLDAAIVVGLASLSMGGDEGAPGGGRRGFDTQGRRVGKDVQRRYAQRYGKEQFLDRFGKKNLKNLSGGMQRNAFQKGARSAFMGLAGKQGAKTVLKFVKPLVNKIPIIGGLIEFGLSWALGEPVGKAAFRGIGSVLVGAIGTAIGGPVGAFLGSWAGGEAGGILYDMFFGNKKVKPQGKVAKAAGGGRPTINARRKPVTRTLKKKKKKPRTISFTPTKIRPGRTAGGEKEIQKVFPNPKKAWWDPLGVFTGKSQPEQQQQQSNKKTANPQEFLIKSNDILGKSDFFGPFFTLAYKTVLGDKPNKLDYMKVGQGLNAWMQGAFKSGPLGFAGGGEVDAKQFFEGEDYTKIIAKSVEDSVSREVNMTIHDLAKELSLRPVGRDEMIQDNIRRGAGGSIGETTLSESEMDLFQRLVYAEAGGEGKTGMALVARSVLNRAGLIQSGKASTGTFSAKDKTVTGVIMGSGQYSPVGNGRINDKRTQKQMDDAKDAIKLAQDIEKLKTTLKSENIDDGSIKKLLASTGFRNYNAGAGYDASQAVNEVRYKRHTFNTAGNTGLVIASSQISEKPTQNIKQPPGGHIVTSGMGNRTLALSPGMHMGVDISGNIGEHLKAFTDGVIEDVGFQSGYGNYVNWIDSSGIAHFYGHMNKPAFVRKGQRIKKGTILGELGSTGRSSGPHLHWETSTNPKDTGRDKSAVLSRFNPLSRYNKESPFTGARFHGGPVLRTGKLLVHKGEYVIDKDSVDLFGIDIIDSINRIENKAQLVANVPLIIEDLKLISGYANYENPEPEIQYVEIPVEVPVPMNMGGSGVSLIASGSKGIDNTYETLEML